MATFSTNQVRQLYVAKAKGTVTDSSAKGTLAVKSDEGKKVLYFDYMGAGGRTRSDLIKIDNILSVSVTDADTMSRSLKSYSVVLDPNIGSGAPLAGQDYILRIAFRQYVGISEEDQYFKYGMVHVTPNMSASDFYRELALSLYKNFSRESSKLLKFALGKASGSVEITATSNEKNLTETYTSVIITEVPQEWVLGKKAQVPVYFTVQPTKVNYNGDELIWGKVTERASSEKVYNGKEIADLEYFCMGERGDIYRYVGFPHNLTTEYMVDPTLKYSVIDIHYAYVGHNESIQKSEKTITIVAPKSTDNTLINGIISDINTATGLSIETL